jgi:hypothetical protein
LHPQADLFIVRPVTFAWRRETELINEETPSLSFQRLYSSINDDVASDINAVQHPLRRTLVRSVLSSAIED